MSAFNYGNTMRLMVWIFIIALALEGWMLIEVRHQEHEIAPKEMHHQNAVSTLLK
ncbi:hypothetical protein JCM19239_2327 [Vibrio variabilis]|uniref:Uncharacterized protein n=1 Tax=Vibrio variabilis TaxID=990271 RepID=A0ABQ0JB74_9VIBR|nr:hypothetical protein JCM19239_2327 [Vibrio variabilis]